MKNSQEPKIGAHIFILAVLLVGGALLWEQSLMLNFVELIKSGTRSESGGHARVVISDKNNQLEKIRQAQSDRLRKLKQDIHFVLSRNECWAKCMEMKRPSCEEHDMKMMDCIESNNKHHRKARLERGHTLPEAR